MADYMGLKLRHIDTTETGGSSYVIHVAHAAEAIAAGQVQRGAHHAGRPAARGGHGHRHRAAQLRRGRARRAFEYPFGPTVVNLYAMAAQRHMHEFGTTSEQLAWIKVAASHHAQHNPARAAARGGHGGRGGRLAHDRRPAAPPRLLRDHRRRRRHRGRRPGDREALKRPRVTLLGAGEAVEAPDGRQDRPHLHRARAGPAPTAFAEAGVTPGRHQVRVDLRQLHDHRADHARGPRLLPEGAGRQASSPTAT